MYTINSSKSNILSPIFPRHICFHNKLKITEKNIIYKTVKGYHKNKLHTHHIDIAHRLVSWLATSIRPPPPPSHSNSSWIDKSLFRKELINSLIIQFRGMVGAGMYTFCAVCVDRWTGGQATCMAVLPIWPVVHSVSTVRKTEDVYTVHL